MSYYLIGIGGTGARCMEAFVHLNGAGLLKDKQPIKLIYVDADVSCGNLQRTQAATEAYTKAQGVGFGNTGLFGNAVEDCAPWSPVPENKQNLDEVLQRSGLFTKTKYEALGLLYDSLFTKEERETPLDKGFRGHPAIGAAVMGSSMDVESVDPWRTLMQKIKTEKDARIFMFASVFGGTGASGFPTIARILQNLLSNDDFGSDKYVAKIGGALILPYFSFPHADDDSEGDMQARVENFMLNTKSALNYYKDSELLKTVFNSIYLVGDNDLSETNNFSLGSNTQKNSAHFIEIFAALAAFDFFNKKDFSKVETPMVARGDNNGEGDIITWEDLPDFNDAVRIRIKNYIKFLFMFNKIIYPQLDKDRFSDPNPSFFAKLRGKGRQAWTEQLLTNKGHIEIKEDAQWIKFVDIKNYSDIFFDWLKQVCDNKVRHIQLVDKEIFADELSIGDKYDLNKIICGDVAKKSLTKVDITRELSSADKDIDPAITGAGILMSAIYSICKKER